MFFPDHRSIAHAEEVAESSEETGDGLFMDGMSPDDEKAIEANKESFTFQAEVNRLMDIIINSLCKWIPGYCTQYYYYYCTALLVR